MKLVVWEKQLQKCFFKQENFLLDLLHSVSAFFHQPVCAAGSTHEPLQGADAELRVDGPGPGGTVRVHQPRGCGGRSTGKPRHLHA